MKETIKFGRYVQEHEEAEPLEWIVLAKEAGKTLLISKFAIESEPFHHTFEPMDWEHSSLKKWLGDEFMHQAFTKEEQERIIGQAFLLSEEEANKYFADDVERQCVPTTHAVLDGALKGRYGGKCIWWLRDGGEGKEYVTVVSLSGEIYHKGFNVTNDSVAVRPAIWIK